MDYTFKDLKKSTVAQLQEIASGIDHEAVKDYTQLNKAPLITAICKALGIDAPELHVAQGTDKASLKAKIRGMKKDRDKALDAHDHKKLKQIRSEMKGLRNQLRRVSA